MNGDILGSQESIWSNPRDGSWIIWSNNGVRRQNGYNLNCITSLLINGENMEYDHRLQRR